MSSSKDVFAKRKEGAIDEAYQLALQLMASPDADEWDRKAMGWCLVDLIKRDAQTSHPEYLEHYRRQLESLQVAPDDEVLQKGIRNALLLCNPNGPLIKQASALSKEGRHAQAVALYRQASKLSPLDSHIETNLGWDLYRHAKQLLDTEPVDFSAIRRNLHDYLKMGVEKPSLLHTCFLQLAAKLANQEKLKLLKFLPLWDLKHLRAEDYQRHRAEDGKEYPSLAEKVIQQAGKEAAASGDAQDLNYILPHLDAAIEQFPDNVWLKLDKAKGLLGLGRHDDALTFGITVTKAKTNEYWAWELLGDIVALTDPAAALGCYCKALCCPADDKFTGKVRLKLAQSMIETQDLPAAKLEVETVLEQKEREGQRIPEVAERIASQPWFASTIANASNADYYRAHAGVAESFLLKQLPWIAATLGDRFVIPDMENKPKRRIFIKTQSDPIEASIPERRFELKGLSVGDGLRIKGEFDEKKRFQIYAIEAGSTPNRWGVFPTRVGVVDHVNHDKKLLHFIVDKTIDGVIPLAELPCPFRQGDAIAVKVSKRSTNKGTVYRVLHAEATDEKPAQQVRKDFDEVVRLSNGMGFTDSDIFIPPPLVVEAQLSDGQQVAGTAILNFNKKHGSWGWKAIALDVSSRTSP
jgi:tetratricopeptide (TPR) repeat protein